MKLIRIIREHTKWLRLRQRMILVYVFGCLVPFLFCYAYMYYASQQNLIRQQIKSEGEMLKMEADYIEQNMDLAVELSTRFSYDEKQGKLIMTRYFGKSSLMVDYRSFSALTDYVEIYYRDIANVVVYLNQDVVGQRRLIDNRHFKLVTETSQQKPWYQNTIEAKGRPRWSYWTNTMTGEISLRLSRVLYNTDKQPVGVVSIALDPNITASYIMQQEYDTLLVHNEKDIVQSNFRISEDELSKIMKDISKKDFDGWLMLGDRKMVAAATQIRQRYSPDDVYHLISIKPYDAMVSSANKNVIISLLPMLFGLVIMFWAVWMLSKWFEKRIIMLEQAMHGVVGGDKEFSHVLIGDARDEIYDLYEDLNQMIQEMQRLSENAANERIQKEQLYSRQKDVEFKMLATQINPHFLYNTLETIRMLGSMNHIHEIEDISTNLTKILRGSLDVGHDLKTLKWEMDIIKCYINIQDYRFGDRIRAEILYEEELGEQYMIMPFVVQPFVENAYVHALEDVEEDGLIQIRVMLEKDKGRLCICVSDNGCGMNEEQLANMTKYLNDFENLDRTHIGVCNVNQRIKLRFGDAYGVDFVSRENEGTDVTIRMPLIIKC